MTINLSPSRLVNFQAVLTPQGVQAQSLNTGLLLGTSAVIDTVTRMRSYQNLTQVGLDFSNNSEEYLAAQIWFGQSPQPTSLNIGRWVKVAAAGQLIGGALTAANNQVSGWTSVTTGSFKIQADAGALTNVPALNFSGAVTMAGVAAIIQAGIQGLGGVYAAVTCTYDAVRGRFVITSGTTGTSSNVQFLQAGSTGVDISAQMAGTAATGAFLAPGLAPETALAAVTLFDVEFGGQWYNLFVPDAIDTDHTAIASYIEGGQNLHFYWINTQEQQVLSTGDTTHIGALLQALIAQHTAWQYSSTSLYAVWSMAARIATVNWAGSLTAISLFYKTEPLITAENLTSAQINALEGYNGNVYVNYSSGGGVGTGSTIIEPGICPSSQFIDTVQGVDALRAQINTNVLNLLIQAPTKIPQTDSGVATLETGVEQACGQFITNGLGAPGVWNSGGFGQLQQGQFLDKGYYIFAPSVGTQTQAQRAARVSPPISVAFKLAGAIDTVSGTIFVNQ